ncbi:UDP-N-acetylglucosamine--N-acetylmuramyl-(pentapeptide) pyrophosphoryl-undecaprenol N-acetylglucosaminetransferase [Striga asiatica]|uniref:UDP-N-acetylglucosamine--N-acetylmuramyl-(Pentapeptide) pyrophosphoryl-undecaprenol N-acetylglucosaminetransferase n=1 Tax=Striga asiatica TaxID=4170 RepID=A0A5A7PGK6_STRAF|nr:UDP-N-acetylglucosamine--N-acetylmuramyl-(pentapeptide) pyrophosphoryl-undecaprenol N-acetylglucosaminetransferase [Striga asiatica]
MAKTTASMSFRVAARQDSGVQRWSRVGGSTTFLWWTQQRGSGQRRRWKGAEIAPGAGGEGGGDRERRWKWAETEVLRWRGAEDLSAVRVGGGASNLYVGASEVRRVLEARRGATGAFGSDFGGEASSGRGAKKRLCRTSRVCTVSRGSRRRTAGESDCEREATSDGVSRVGAVVAVRERDAKGQKFLFSQT